MVNNPERIPVKRVKDVVRGKPDNIAAIGRTKQRDNKIGTRRDTPDAQCLTEIFGVNVGKAGYVIRHSE
jgi:hypothetical protein